MTKIAQIKNLSKISTIFRNYMTKLTIECKTKQRKFKKKTKIEKLERKSILTTSSRKLKSKLILIT